MNTLKFKSVAFVLTVLLTAIFPVFIVGVQESDKEVENPRPIAVTATERNVVNRISAE